MAILNLFGCENDFARIESTMVTVSNLNFESERFVLSATDNNSEHKNSRHNIRCTVDVHIHIQKYHSVLLI